MLIPETKGNWVLDLKNGSENWEFFYNKFHSFICSVLIKNGVIWNDIDDECQNVIIKCIENLDKFQYDITEDGLKRWVARIAINTAKNSYRKRESAFKKIDEYKSSLECEMDKNLYNSELEDKQDYQFIITKAKKYFNDKHLSIYLDLLLGVSPKSLSIKYNTTQWNIYAIRKRMNKKIIEWGQTFN